MGAIFSRRHHHHQAKRPKVTITDHDRAVLDLKVAKDRLKKYQIKMRSESSRLQEQAKELVLAGRKDRALIMLKMRRLREQENEKAESQLLNVEQLISQIEWETEQLKVFDALKSGNAALEAIHKIMSIEEVEKLMADTADSIEYEQEVSRMLSENLSTVSEEEVLAEFEKLEAATEAEAKGETAPTADTTTTAAAAAAAKPVEEEKTAIGRKEAEEEEEEEAAEAEKTAIGRKEAEEEEEEAAEAVLPPAAAAAEKVPELPDLPTHLPIPEGFLPEVPVHTPIEKVAEDEGKVTTARGHKEGPVLA